MINDLHAYIDHTLLKAVATTDEIKKLCEEAKKLQFASVCVNSSFLPLVSKELALTKVGIGTVVGFPLGAQDMKVKIFETKRAIEEGATEIDMVIHIGALKEGWFDYVQEEISEVKRVATYQLLKVILETCYLTEEEIIRGCQICMAAGADFVKTSTGFGTAGATVSHVQLMRKIVGHRMGVKASGGIKDKMTALAMIHAGATRIGTSSGVALVS